MKSILKLIAFAAFFFGVSAFGQIPPKDKQPVWAVCYVEKQLADQSGGFVRAKEAQPYDKSFRTYFVPKLRGFAEEDRIYLLCTQGDVIEIDGRSYRILIVHKLSKNFPDLK